MSTPYNLRSLQRKRSISIRNCHSYNFTGNGSPEAFNPKVCLERLKLLECYNIQDNKIYVKNGRIIMKPKKSNPLNKKKLLLKILCIAILIAVPLIYWKDHMQIRNFTVIKNYTEIYPTIQKNYSDAFIFPRSLFNSCQSKPGRKNNESNFVIPKEYLQIREVVREYFADLRKKNKIKNAFKTSGSFIEEQCKRYIEEDFSAAKSVKNTTLLTLLDEAYLTDYALESQGAKIVTAYDTESYGTVTLKLFNFKLWPGFSQFLLQYLKGCDSRGPSSVLTYLINLLFSAITQPFN